MCCLRRALYWIKLKLGLSTPDLALLKRRGLRLGKDVTIMPGAVIDPSHCWLIEIGDRSGIAESVILLAHDASTLRTLGYVKVGQIRIGSDVFIGIRSILLPGSSVGDGSIIGAGSVVTGSIPPGVVAAGVPARVIMTREEYFAKEAARLAEGPRFEAEYTIRGGITDAMKKEMVERIGEGIGYVR